jgi:hypothetical protein
MPPFDEGLSIPVLPAQTLGDSIGGHMARVDRSDRPYPADAGRPSLTRTGAHGTGGYLEVFLAFLHG